MKNHRKILILYTTAVCNLNCTYCFIDKNPALVKIDEWLDKSFLETPNYYIDFAKEMFSKEQLTEMQFWGGEPFLAMHRAYHTVEEAIKYFPNLSKFMVSTNMVSDQFMDEFKGLVDILKKFPDRNFYFQLQLSCDGPKEINDKNRGYGVTEKIQNRFKEIVTYLSILPNKNLFFSLSFKPTLDAEAIKNLQTEELIIHYFQFFENFYEYFIENNKNKNIKMPKPIPNLASPAPHTQEDGKNFANYCRLTRKIEKENKLKYYTSITSYQRKYNGKTSLINPCKGHCGVGVQTLGLLPNGMISCCHNGFVDLIGEYKKNVLSNNSNHMDSVTIEKGIFTNTNNSLIFHKDSKEFKDFEKKMLEFRHPQSTIKTTNLASLIMLLARYGQIEEKYKNKFDAVQGAIFILASTAYCVRDNLGVTGSVYTYPLGYIRLLLNGAREYIEECKEYIYK